MYHLLIDVGNTRIKSMMLDDVVSEEIPLKEAYVAAVHDGEFDSAVNECFGELFSVETLSDSACVVFVANVAGILARHALDNFFASRPFCELIYVEVERQSYGIKNGYQRLPELGVDRWMAVIGARQLFETGPVIAVNCGTAITVDYLSADNEFIGGAILPGFDLSFSALSKADGVAQFKASDDVFVLGDTTQDCVRLGVMFACVGGVEKIISNILSSIASNIDSSDISVVLSGGAAKIFLSLSALDCIHDANLVFRGLKQYAK